MKLFSPIAFKSNVYPLKQRNENIRMDRAFLEQIRSRKAVAFLHDQIKKRAITEWMYTPNAIQNNIYKKLVCEPAYCILYPDTQPWGEVYDADRNEKVVCKCNQINCPGYKYCKPFIENVKIPEVKPDTQQKRMENWQLNCKILQQQMEGLKLRYNAVTPVDARRIQKNTRTIGETDQKFEAVETWLQSLKDLVAKNDIEAYNNELQNKKTWLNKISRLETTLEKIRTEINKYNKTTQLCKEFHMNWLADWSDLKKTTNEHIEKKPAELYVSDLADKVKILQKLIAQLDRLSEKHESKKEQYESLKQDCKKLSDQIQTLSEKADADNQAIQELNPREVKVDVQHSIPPTPTPVADGSFFDSFKEVDQKEFIKQPITSKVMVNAGPGTGKTYSLIERIVHLVKDEHIDASDITVLCFSRAATAEVLNRIQKRCTEDEDLEGLDWQIGTIDSYCWMLKNCNDDQADSSLISSGSYDDGIQNAIRCLKNTSETLSTKYVIVDEIQDIIGVRGRFILELLRHLDKECGFAVLGDFCQAIYDFQVDKTGNDFTAVQFIKKLSEIDGISKFTFGHNYRSDAQNELNKKLNELRPALMNENANDAFQKVTNIGTSQILAEDDVDDMINAILEDSEFEPEKTVGVLVRTNAAVTEIASKFYNQLSQSENFVPIHIQRRKEAAYLAGWIGLFFQNYDGTYIDQNTFIDEFDSLFTDDKRQKLNLKYPAIYYWNALDLCMANDESYGQDRFEVERLLRNVSLNAWSFRENCGVLLSGILQDSPIVISNVHQAKGREYDKVVLSTKLLSFRKRDDTATNEDCRVAYVALSRSRGNVGVFRTENHKYRSTTQNRHYLMGITKGHIQKVEFGLYRDLDNQAFANEEMQDYIQNDLPVGEMLQLNQSFRGNDSSSLKNLCYELSMDGGELGVPDILGRASSSFIYDLGAVTSKNSSDNTCFPKSIDDLYVNDLITFIEQDKGQDAGLSRFGDIVIWNGLSVMGMGDCHY